MSCSGLRERFATFPFSYSAPIIGADVGNSAYLCIGNQRKGQARNPGIGFRKELDV